MEFREELIELYRQVSSDIRKFPDFPYNRCQDVSRYIVEQLPHRNLKQVWLDGFFRVDKSFSRSEPLYLFSEHSWVTTPEEIIIDMTAWQFNRWLNSPVPETVLIVTPTDHLYQRFSQKLPTPYKAVWGIPY